MTAIRFTRQASVADQVDALDQRIAQRAYERFLARGEEAHDPLADWLAAERELVWSPALALRERDDAFVVDVALPGLDAGDIALDVTPNAPVLQTDGASSIDDDPGTVHYCDLAGGTAFRTLTWPRPIDVSQTRAVYRNGMLRITAPIAPASSSPADPRDSAGPPSS